MRQMDPMRGYRMDQYRDTVKYVMKLDAGEAKGDFLKLGEQAAREISDIIFRDALLQPEDNSTV